MASKKFAGVCSLSDVLLKAKGKIMQNNYQRALLALMFSTVLAVSATNAADSWQQDVR